MRSRARIWAPSQPDAYRGDCVPAYRRGFHLADVMLLPASEHVRKGRYVACR